jgi:hypothetical protein
MERKLIVAYRMGWNPSNNVQRGYVELMLEGANQPTRVPIHSAQEFAAIGEILRRSPIFLYANGLISTNPERPGDED